MDPSPPTEKPSLIERIRQWLRPVFPITQWIPGTTAFHWRLLQDVVARGNLIMDQTRQLRSVDPAARESLARAIFGRSGRAVAVGVLGVRAMHTVFLSAYLALALPLFLTLVSGMLPWLMWPFHAPPWLPRPFLPPAGPDVLTLPSQIVAGLLAMVLMLAILRCQSLWFLPLTAGVDAIPTGPITGFDATVEIFVDAHATAEAPRPAPRRGEGYWAQRISRLSRGLLPSVAVSAALFYLWDHSSATPVRVYTFPAAIALAMNASFMLSVVVAYNLGGCASYAFGRWQRASFPDAYACLRLHDALIQTEDPANWWEGLPFRRGLLADLESAARCIEHDLPRALRSGDATTDEWFRTTMSRASAALRAKKKWLLSPRPDTRDHFASAIAQTLLHLAEGDWDALEQTDPERLPRLEAVGNWAATWPKALLFAALPALGIWALRSHFPTYLPEEYVKWAVPLAAVWAWISLTAALDPHLDTKLDMAGKGMGLFFPWLRGK